MRDAFGGVFMMRLMLVFIFVFISFTAISLNYAKAFRIKNHVIDFVEQQEVLSLDDLFEDNSALEKLDNILNNANYNKECANGNGEISRVPGTGSAYCYRGIILEEDRMVNRTIIYNVYAYADWNLGTLNMLLALGGQSKNSRNVINGSWEISGEARVMSK